MKKKNFLFFLTYITLFNISKQILENEIIKLEELPLNNNKGFEMLVNYPNEKDAINVQINSLNEDLNNYYYKYYYIKNEESNIILLDNEYYNKPNKTMIVPEAKYIIAEIKHKLKNNKIYIKSEIINYNQKNIDKEIINNNNNEYKLEIFSTNFSYLFKDNCPSLIIFFSTFCLATTTSVILILIDLNEDKKIVKIYNLATKERAYQEFNNLRNTYITKNIFKFACFLMKYTYPIFNIFTIYNFDHPRYIRFFIVLIKIVFNFLISFLLFAIFYKKDIKEFPQVILSFLYSLIASFIIYIISELITRKNLEYDKIRRDIWKPKFENLRKYIFYTVKKDILFNSKWHFIKNRMISYTRICGNIILRDKPDDKYKTYANNKLRSYKAALSENISRSPGASQSGEDKESELFAEKFTANTFNIKTKNSNTLLGYHMRRKKTFFAKTNDNSINARLYIEKGVQSFSISKFGQNNLKLRTVQKIEDIRNRYIINNNESKFDETLEVNSFVKTYDNLEIETLENYTYISTDSTNTQLHNTSSESNKIFLNLITTLVVLLLLALVDFGLILVYKLIQDKSDFDNDKFLYFCVIPVIFQITVFNFCWSYLINLMISFFIFKCYGYKKKRFLFKIIFKLFVEKYIKYIYKIRLLIIKYNKELEFIDREK